MAARIATVIATGIIMNKALFFILFNPLTLFVSLELQRVLEGLCKELLAFLRLEVSLFHLALGYGNHNRNISLTECSRKRSRNSSGYNSARNGTRSGDQF